MCVAACSPRGFVGGLEGDEDSGAVRRTSTLTDEETGKLAVRGLLSKIRCRLRSNASD